MYFMLKCLLPDPVQYHPWKPFLEKTEEQVSGVTSAAVIPAQACTRDSNFHILILVHTYPIFSYLNSTGSHRNIKEVHTM